MKISYSGVNDFKSCPKKYYLKKQYRLKYEASAFAFGSAVESGVTALLEGKDLKKAYEVFSKEWETRPANKWEGAKPIKGNTDVFFYKSDFDKKLLDNPKDSKFVEEVFEKLKDDKKISEEDQLRYNELMWESCNKRGFYLLEAFQRDFMPHIKEVIACQREISIPNEEGDEVVGFVDYILKLEVDGQEKTYVVDLKTAGAPYDTHKLDTSDQLRIYSAALDIPSVAYMVLLKKLSYNTFCDKCGHKRENYRLKNCSECSKGKYSISEPYAATQFLCTDLKNEDMGDTLHDFSEVLTAMKNGIEWKNPESCHRFGTVCEFYQHCWGRKPLEELENLKKK